MRARHFASVVVVVLVLCSAAPARPAGDADSTRRETFETVWKIVNESFYDPAFNGVDWNAVRERYAPRVAALESDAKLYPLLNEMLGELKASHFSVRPPEAGEGDTASASDPTWGGGVGLTARLVEGRVTITHVEPRSPADEAGLRPGFVLTRVGETNVADVERRASEDAGRPVYAMLRARRAVAAPLLGMPGSAVDVAYLDADGAPHTATLVREQIVGKPLKFGEMPTIIARVEAKRLEDGVGYVRFNIFLPEMLDEIRAAIRSFKDAPAVVVDLRNNPGGVGAMAPSIAAMFLDRETPLGTMKMRRGELRFVAFKQETHYAGPLVFLVDEGSASTSEILAGSMQEAGRAVVVGQPSLGAVLPSVITKLPNGAIFQYAVADFRTPKGVLLEGRGVAPDVAVPLRRADFLAGRDPVLDAALAHVRRARPAQRTGSL
jgi:carboxyl-terminal processing protease